MAISCGNSKTEWVELPKAPLAPRARTVEVWTGREVLVVGGDTFTCPANADCAGPVDPPLADGAAFNPSTGAWRTIATSPVAFSAASTAVLGDDVYFLVPHAFLRYSTAKNSWARLPRPTNGGVGNLVAVDDAVVAFAGSDELGEQPDLVFDHELVPNPGSERPSLTRAARLDLDSGKWERLPDSEILGAGAEAFVFGGVRWAGGRGELLGDAWIWRPHRAQPATETMTQSGGCGDAFFWAANATSTVTVTVDARDRSTTEPTAIDFTLPDPKVKVEIQRGRGLVQPFCNDVIDANVWRVDSRSAATAATGRITLDAATDALARCGATTGELHLSGVAADDGMRLAALDIETHSIGCYAG